MLKQAFMVAVWGLREHGGGLLHEVSLAIGGGEAPTVHGR